MKLNTINWVNQAKGIGILLVVIGHMTIPLELSILIFSFHMPLFFFLSGYLFNEKKYGYDLKTIIVSKFSSLIWPFITFTFLAILLKTIYDLENTWKNLDYLGFLMGIKSINVPLWFLTALFSTEIIFSQIVRFTKHKLILIILFTLILVIIGFLNIHFFHISLLSGIHIALIALIFFLGGWLSRRLNIFELIDKNKTLILYLIISLISLFYFSLNNSRLDMFESNYGNLLYVFIAAFRYHETQRVGYRQG